MSISPHRMGEGKAMTAQELAQQILAIAQKALEERSAIYIGDDVGMTARAGLEAIIKLCQDVPKDQDAFKQYEKKVSHESSKD
jgi:hypothetical protein